MLHMLRSMKGKLKIYTVKYNCQEHLTPNEIDSDNISIFFPLFFLSSACSYDMANCNTIKLALCIVTIIKKNKHNEKGKQMIDHTQNARQCRK